MRAPNRTRASTPVRRLKKLLPLKRPKLLRRANNGAFPIARTTRGVFHLETAGAATRSAEQQVVPGTRIVIGSVRSGSGARPHASMRSVQRIRVQLQSAKNNRALRGPPRRRRPERSPFRALQDASCRESLDIVGWLAKVLNRGVPRFRDVIGRMTSQVLGNRRSRRRRIGGSTRVERRGAPGVGTWPVQTRPKSRVRGWGAAHCSARLLARRQRALPVS